MNESKITEITGTQAFELYSKRVESGEWWILCVPSPRLEELEELLINDECGIPTVQKWIPPNPQLTYRLRGWRVVQDIERTYYWGQANGDLEIDYHGPTAIVYGHKRRLSSKGLAGVLWPDETVNEEVMNTLEEVPAIAYVYQALHNGRWIPAMIDEAGRLIGIPTRRAKR